MNDPDTLHAGHGEHKTKSFLATSFNSVFSSLAARSASAVVPGGGGGGAPGDGPMDTDKVL